MLRIVLRVAEYPYTLVVVARNRRYDQRTARVQKVAVPVISVGNLTLGGTGKTPMVQFLARRFRERGIRVAIVSRGYRAASGQRNDEARELAEKLPDVPHLQNPDRVAAARVAVDQLGVQLVVLDDGFQHRRLARDLDLVLVDALEPFGYGHVFPRGMLREPVSGLNRADIVALSRADLIDHARRDEVRQLVAAINPRAVFIEVAHCARQLLGRAASEEIATIRGKRVAAFCGLGNPEGFRRTLERCGARIVAFREFPDHHDYSDEDIRSLGEWSLAEAAETVICTHKDLVKIDIDSLRGIPLRALIVELEVQSGGAALEQKLSELLDSNS